MSKNSWRSVGCRSTTRPCTDGRQPFEGAVRALHTAERGCLHHVLAQQEAEQIDAVDPHGQDPPGSADVLRLSEGFLQTARAKTRMTAFAQLMADAPAA
jgi:hypothetical protein